VSIEFINKSEFARREGCDEKQIRRAIEKGILVANSEGLLDSSQVKSGWRKSNRRSNLKVVSDNSDIVRTTENVRESFARTDDEVNESAEEAAERLLASGNAPLLNYADALQLKENYIGRLRQLEYEQKSGNLIDLELAQGVLFEEFRNLRDAWLNWPVKFGAEIAADLGLEADKVVEVLGAYVYKQIEQLGEPDAQFTRS
jgi:hypothetical protein